MKEVFNFKRACGAKLSDFSVYSKIGVCALFFFFGGGGGGGGGKKFFKKIGR